MKVLVAGATGAVGRRLVPQLVERGHEVFGTTTQVGKFELVHTLGADAVVMDGLDPVEVQDVVARTRPDAVVTAASKSGSRERAPSSSARSIPSMNSIA